MSNETDDKQLQSILLESTGGVAELLRSASHPMRIQILALLLRGEHDFSKLMQQTELSKTALANHLKHLMNKKLIQRVTRGEYRLTVDGKELLNAVAAMYKNSAQREEDQRELLLRRYTKGLIEGKTMGKKVISKKAEYQPCWLSYTGAIAGSLKALGIDCDIVDVGGRSSYAFLINVSKGVTCPSGPTALPSETWKQINRGTETLGWTMEKCVYPSSYPAKEDNPTSEEIEIAKNLFMKIKQEIDERDRPAVLWGLVAPEYGIVKGYDGDSYLTSTFRSLIKQPEDAIRFYDLKAPGCLEAFFFRDRVECDAAKADREALERAISFASGSAPILDNYVGGPAALIEWANVLENIPEEKQIYHGNSYVGACVCEGRSMSAEFLRRLSKKYPGKQSKHLKKAAELYEKGGALMKEFTQIFPFKFQGEMKLEDRKKGAETLRKVKPLEENAVEHMKKALEEWKTP
ncbi:MAG: winged helix-turn-helix domain-containing protein [Candidatus Bathyarchaeota archaeon]